MYQQYQQPPHHQSHGGQGAGGQGTGGQAAGGHQSREAVTQQMYRSELATLTFNSKPIITSLTIAAGDNISVSKLIVQAIEDRLRTAPPNQKLPTLYLIDSIIKNVGGPYLNLFGRTIINLFLDAYSVVDSSARASFEKVLGTWPNWNTQLFPRETISRIEHGVQSIRQQEKKSYQAPMMHVNPHFSERLRDNTHNHGPGQMSRPVEPSADNVLLQDIQLLMLQKQQAIILNPGDQASIKQVDILQQLETIVRTTQLTPENANMIRQQLAQLWAPPTVPPTIPGFPQGGSSPMPPNMIIAPLPQHLQQLPIHPPNAPSTSMAAPQLPPFPGVPPSMFAPHLHPPGSAPSPHTMMTSLPTSMPILPGNIPLSGAGMSMSLIPPPAPPAAPALAPAPVASDLITSLMQSGFLGPNGSLTNQLLQSTANMSRVSPPPLLAAAAVATPPLPNIPLDRTGQTEQDQNVMSLGLIELTSQDIQRRRPTAIQIMYGTPPLQCNQCGYRCPKSADAQKKMDAHLDWHFRQNRRMKDKAKKSHSRSWLVGEEDWIHSREGDLSQSQQPVFFDFGSGVSKTSKDELALQEEIAALKEQIISEPSLVESLRGDEAHTITQSMAENAIAKGCSICKEKFIKVWSDNDEEWSYKNARVVDKVIYHSTCYADLVRSSQRQAVAAATAATAAAVTAAAAAASASVLAATTIEMTMAPHYNSELKPTSSEVAEQKDSNTGILSPDNVKKVDPEATATAELHDQEMTCPDSDLPLSLKRKLEIDQQEQDQEAAKKIILAQDS